MIGSFKTKIKIVAITLLSAALLTGCNANLEQIEQMLEVMAQNSEQNVQSIEDLPEEVQEVIAEAKAADQADEADEAAEEDGRTLPTKDIYIIYTSDVHCGIDQGFGYAGLEQIRDGLRAKGYDTILVDDGDFVQGEAVGTLSKGESIIPIMNALKYDVVIPGNHEFDYGMDDFFKVVEMADFPFISCNFNKEGKLVFEPYIIKEAGGKKIAFVGVTTPETLAESQPKTFMDDKGNYIYGFMQGSGEELYRAVQDAVDAARAEGADFVYLMAHLGNYPESVPYRFSDVIANTTGIDVVLDGHSHDTEQVVMKNKEGKEVTRSACGTKFNCIGYSHIFADGDEVKTDTGIWSWHNDVSIPELLGITNEIGDMVDKTNSDLAEKLDEIVAMTDVELTINAPTEGSSEEEPVRAVRSTETNLGDLVADAFRIRTGSDIGIVNGGGIRASIPEGEVTFRKIMDVNPFGNRTIVIEATGQQVADALEWSCRNVPDEFGGFLQVSGISFDVDTKIESPCTSNEAGLMTGINGDRRVSNIKVGDKPLDLKATYTVAGISYVLIDKGNGFTAFEGAKVINSDAGLDNQILIEYITETLGGKIGEEYSDPLGQGRIVIN